jgi:hypothetical protein
LAVDPEHGRHGKYRFLLAALHDGEQFVSGNKVSTCGLQSELLPMHLLDPPTTIFLVPDVDAFFRFEAIGIDPFVIALNLRIDR